MEIPVEIQLLASAEGIAQEQTEAPVEIRDAAISCMSCRSTFPVSEAHRDSNGYCECGGALTLRATAVAVKPSASGRIQFEVVKA